jgi:peptidoglycan/xylan/chitin deacetylase (PgdA/CDA1 family)
VFPGNITDPIGEEDYEQLLKIFDKTGYTNTWFVAGEEGQEFGRKTYEEIVSVDSTFNRLHIYGPTLSKMPVLDSD